MSLGIIVSELINNYSKNKLLYTFIIMIILIISIDGIVEYGIYGIGLIYIFTKIDILNCNIKTLLWLEYYADIFYNSYTNYYFDL